MVSLGSWNHPKTLLLTALTLVIILTVANAAYTGTRYGKREPFDSIGRMAPRSDRDRNIQSRSSGTRFYPGTRFGGKRSYWQTQPQPTPILSELIENSDNFPSSNIPYDCVYKPFIGVRCSRVEENNYLNNNNNDEEQMIRNDGFESGDGSGSSTLVAAAAGAGGP